MTTLDGFLTTVNNKYGVQDKLAMARSVFQDNINIGEAVVNVLSSTGVAGFRFHVPEGEQVSMESDITDHYTDANTVMQDHVARRPILMTITGLQGEYFYSIHEIEDLLANVTPVLSLVKQFVPKLSAATIQTKQNWSKYREAQQGLAAYYATFDKGIPLNQSFNNLWNSLNGVDLFQLFQNLYKLKSAQARAFLYFDALWKSQAVFSVETTWKRYDNVMVQKVIALRERNADITEFSVVLKQMNFAQSRYESLNNAAGRTRQQLLKQVNKGIDKGSQAEAV